MEDTDFPIKLQESWEHATLMLYKQWLFSGIEETPLYICLFIVYGSPVVCFVSCDSCCCEVGLFGDTAVTL